MKNLKVIGEKMLAVALIFSLSISSATIVAAAKPDPAVKRIEMKQTPEVEMEAEGLVTIDASAASKETNTSETPEAEEAVSTAIYSPEDLKFQGVIWYEGYRYTWYSEKALPGGGLNIPGRHVDENGYVCDEDDFICLASRDLAKGTEVDIPFGKKGKIYDWCAISGTLDVYVSW